MNVRPPDRPNFHVACVQVPLEMLEDGKTIGRARGGLWIVTIAVALVAGHGILLYCGSSHLALSATAVSIVAVLVIVKHFGWLGTMLRVS